MAYLPYMRKYLKLRANIAFGLIFAFLLNSFGPLPTAQAQDFVLPAPGLMVPLSLEYNPPILKGIKVHPDNPFRFDFILDQGDEYARHPERSEGSQQEQFKTESTRLIKYFLASLTIPEKDLWVNLSPYEKDRIIPQSFGLTEMGRDLLAEDYMLKQITASLVYPEGEAGRRFWKRIYQEAANKFGTTNIPVNTFNKVWIVPEKAVVYENAKAGTAYIVESKLKVMLEQDYLSLEKHQNTVILSEAKDLNALGSKIVREIVIPELTKEVNTGKNFFQLRQVYNSLILAFWYKKKIKESVLSHVYADQGKVAGVNIDDEQEKERIYQRYLQAFKKGVFNYIKDSDTPDSMSVPRKYFSGGATFDAAALSTAWKPMDHFNPTKTGNYAQVTTDLAMTLVGNDSKPDIWDGFADDAPVAGDALWKIVGEWIIEDQIERRSREYQVFPILIIGGSSMLEASKIRSALPDIIKFPIVIVDPANPRLLPQQQTAGITYIKSKAESFELPLGMPKPRFVLAMRSLEYTHLSQALKHVREIAEPDASYVLIMNHPLSPIVLKTQMDLYYWELYIAAMRMGVQYLKNKISYEKLDGSIRIRRQKIEDVFKEKSELAGFIFKGIFERTSDGFRYRFERMIDDFISAKDAGIEVRESKISDLQRKILKALRLFEFYYTRYAALLSIEDVYHLNHPMSDEEALARLSAWGPMPTAYYAQNNVEHEIREAGFGYFTQNHTFGSEAKYMLFAFQLTKPVNAAMTGEQLVAEIKGGSGMHNYLARYFADRGGKDEHLDYFMQFPEVQEALVKRLAVLEGDEFLTNPAYLRQIFNDTPWNHQGNSLRDLFLSSTGGRFDLVQELGAGLRAVAARLPGELEKVIDLILILYFMSRKDDIFIASDLDDDSPMMKNWFGDQDGWIHFLNLENLRAEPSLKDLPSYNFNRFLTFGDLLIERLTGKDPNQPGVEISSEEIVDAMQRNKKLGDSVKYFLALVDKIQQRYNQWRQDHRMGIYWPNPILKSGLHRKSLDLLEAAVTPTEIVEGLELTKQMGRLQDELIEKIAPWSKDTEYVRLFEHIWRNHWVATMGFFMYTLKDNQYSFLSGKYEVLINDMEQSQLLLQRFLIPNNAQDLKDWSARILEQEESLKESGNGLNYIRMARLLSQKQFNDEDFKEFKEKAEELNKIYERIKAIAATFARSPLPGNLQKKQEQLNAVLPFPYGIVLSLTNQGTLFKDPYSLSENTTSWQPAAFQANDPPWNQLFFTVDPDAQISWHALMEEAEGKLPALKQHQPWQDLKARIDSAMNNAIDQSMSAAEWGDIKSRLINNFAIRNAFERYPDLKERIRNFLDSDDPILKGIIQGKTINEMDDPETLKEMERVLRMKPQYRGIGFGEYFSLREIFLHPSRGMGPDLAEILISSLDYISWKIKSHKVNQETKRNIRHVYLFLKALEAISNSPAIFIAKDVDINSRIFKRLISAGVINVFPKDRREASFHFAQLANQSPVRFLSLSNFLIKQLLGKTRRKVTVEQLVSALVKPENKENRESIKNYLDLLDLLKANNALWAQALDNSPNDFNKLVWDSKYTRQLYDIDGYFQNIQKLQSAIAMTASGSKKSELPAMLEKLSNMVDPEAEEAYVAAEPAVSKMNSIGPVYARRSACYPVSHEMLVRLEKNISLWVTSLTYFNSRQYLANFPQDLIPDSNNNPGNHTFLLVRYKGRFWIVDPTWQQFLPSSKRGHKKHVLIAELRDLPRVLKALGVPLYQSHIWRNAFSEDRFILDEIRKFPGYERFKLQDLWPDDAMITVDQVKKGLTLLGLVVSLELGIQLYNHHQPWAEINFITSSHPDAGRFKQVSDFFFSDKESWKSLGAKEQIWEWYGRFKGPEMELYRGALERAAELAKRQPAESTIGLDGEIVPSNPNILYFNFYASDQERITKKRELVRKIIRDLFRSKGEDEVNKIIFVIESYALTADELIRLDHPGLKDSRHVVLEDLQLVRNAHLLIEKEHTLWDYFAGLKGGIFSLEDIKFLEQMKYRKEAATYAQRIEEMKARISLLNIKPDFRIKILSDIDYFVQLSEEIGENTKARNAAWLNRIVLDAKIRQMRHFKFLLPRIQPPQYIIWGGEGHYQDVLEKIKSNSRLKQGVVENHTVNKAMAHQGGIDLTSGKFLQTKNSGEEILFHPDPAMLARYQNAQGFVPVIIDYKSLPTGQAGLADLRAFLGIADN